LNGPTGLFEDWINYSFNWTETGNHIVRGMRFDCESGYGTMQRGCAQYSCFGIDADSPEVCSGSGNCTGPNTCECYSQDYLMGEMCEHRLEIDTVTTVHELYEPTYLTIYQNELAISTQNGVISYANNTNTTYDGTPTGLCIDKLGTLNYADHCSLVRNNGLSHFPSDKKCGVMDSDIVYKGLFSNISGIVFDTVTEQYYVCEPEKDTVKRVDAKTFQTCIVLDLPGCGPHDIIEDYDTDFLLITCSIAGIIIRFNKFYGSYFLFVGTLYALPDITTTETTYYMDLPEVRGIAKSDVQKQYLFSSVNGTNSNLHFYSLHDRQIKTIDVVGESTGGSVLGNADYFVFDKARKSYFYSAPALNKVKQIAFKCPNGTTENLDGICEWICGTFASTDPFVCTGHGTCYKPDDCHCDINWGGSLCSIPVCNDILANDSSVCSGHGVCSAVDTCDCLNGTTGTNCEIEPVSSFPASSMYSNSGITESSYTETPLESSIDFKEIVESNYSLVITGALDNYNPCSNITLHTEILLDGSVASEQVFALYQWDIVSPVIIPSEELLQVLSAAQESIQIPTTLLATLSTFTIRCLVLLPFNNTQVSANVTFTVSDFIFSGSISGILTELELVVRRFQKLTFKSVLTDIPFCFNNTPSIRWTVTEIATGNEILSSADPVVFIIEPYTLVVPGRYTVKLFVENQLIDTRTFKLLLVPIQLTVIGGNNITIPVNTSYTFMLHIIDDEYPLDSKIVTWCSVDSDNCVQEPSLPFTATVTGIFHYNVSVNSTLHSRQQHTVLTITVPPPEVKIPVVVIETPVSAIINTRNKLPFNARIIVGNLSQISMEWSVIDKRTGIPLVLDRSKTRSSITSRTLVLRESALDTGKEYIFRIQAKYNNESFIAYSQVSARTIQRPLAWMMFVTPTSGISIDTVFKMNVPESLDEQESLPLLYSFSYLDQSTNQWNILSEFSETIDLSSQLLASLNDSDVTVNCRIRNYYGEEVSVNQTIPVQHRVLNTSDIETILDQITSETPDTGRQLLLASQMYTQLENPNESLYAAILHLLSVLPTQQNLESNTQWVESLSYLSANPELIVQRELQQKLLEIAHAVLNNTGISSLEYRTRVGGFISSAMDLTEDSTYSPLVSQIIDLLSEQVFLNLSPGEDTEVIRTSNFLMLFKTNYAPDVGNKQYGTVYLPQSRSIPNDNDEVISIEYINFNAPSSILYGYDRSLISNNIVSLRILDSHGTVIEYTTDDNSNPLAITLETDGTLDVIRCKSKEYYGAIWDTYGCWLGNITDTTTTCLCNHTTSYATFIEYSGKESIPVTPISQGVYYVQIASHGVYCIVIASLLTILFFSREKQPIRSRLFAPYFCLIALLLESILQGIIRNVLMLESCRNILAYNIVGNICMIIVNPLAIVSLFIFLWQNLRYFVLRHLYEIMGKNQGTKSVMLMIGKTLVSKHVFLVSGIVVYVFVTVYFAIFSGVGMAKQKSFTQEDANSLTIATSVSYLTMMIIVSVGIIVTFIYDALVNTILNRSDAVTPANQNVPRTNVLQSIFALFRNHFVRDDPLLFRLDSLFITCSVLIGVISFGIGITESYIDRNEDYGLIIVYFVFDLLYTGLRIFGFGGFLTIIRFKALLCSSGISTNDYSNEKSYDEVDDTHDIILKTLMSERGYQVMKEYTIREFSLENVLIWSELHTLHYEWTALTQEARNLAIIHICDKYVASGSACEVNIPSAIRNQVLDVQKNLETTSIEVQQQMLYKLFSATMINLADTFARMCETKEYKQYVAIEIIQRELLEKNLRPQEETLVQIQKKQEKWFDYPNS
jgi:hypothetical protein